MAQQMPAPIVAYQVDVIANDQTVQGTMREDNPASVLCEVQYDEVLDKNGNKIKAYRGFTRKPNIVTGGIMVYMPAGHSVHLESEEHARTAFKLDMVGGLVDPESGERVNYNPEPNYKHAVERATAAPRYVGKPSVLD